MARNRVTYQSEMLCVGPTPATGYHFLLDGATGVVSDTLADADEADGRLSLITEENFANLLTNSVKQLHRVQGVSHDFNITKTPINQFGELAAIDHAILTTPTVSLNFSYLLAHLGNERSLGFVTDGQNSAVKDIIDKTSDEKNYFIKTVSEGVDAIGDTSNAGEVIGVGHGFITSYSSTASVGDLPQVSVSVEGLNLIFDNGVSGRVLPAIDFNTNDAFTGYTFHIPDGVSNQDGLATGDLAISVLRPGDITLSIKKRLNQTEDVATTAYDIGGVDIDNACIQSYNVSFDLSRTPIECLGKRYAIDRPIDFPVPVNVSVDALVGDLVTGRLEDIVNCDEKYDVIIDLREPACIGQSSDIIARYIVKDCEYESSSYNSSIGDNKSVTLNFVGQISGPSQTNRGLFMSGLAGA